MLTFVGQSRYASRGGGGSKGTKQIYIVEYAGIEI